MSTKKYLKIPIGSVVDLLKWYVYLTGDIGVPSKKNEGLFIYNFSNVIMNNNFKISDNTVRELKDIVISNAVNVDIQTIDNKVMFYRDISRANIKDEESLIDYLENYRAKEVSSIRYIDTKEVNIESKEEGIGERKFNGNIFSELKKVRKFSDIPLVEDAVNANLNGEIEIIIYPREGKIELVDNKIESLELDNLVNLEDITMRYVLDTLNVSISDIDADVINIYIETLDEWKRTSDGFPISYLYE